MAVIHLWGFDERPSLVSPESIGIFWLVNYYNISCTIIFSNNTDMSPNKELPLGIFPDGFIAYGFLSIVERLLNFNGLLLELSLVQFTLSKINALTEYQLYLNKKNYEQFTRKVFSYLLHWPLWYNAPLHYRNIAKQKCVNEFYINDTSDTDIAEQTTKNLTHNKTFQQTQKKDQRDHETLESIKHDMQYFGHLSSALKPYVESRDTMPEKLTTSDFLLYANLFVQLELPDGARISKFVEESFPDLYNGFQEFRKTVSSREVAGNVNIRAPTFSESGNIVIEIYRLIRNMF